LSRISSAFSSFFSILFGGELPVEVAEEFGYAKKEEEPAAPPEPEAGPSEGALQMLSILQRDARLVDFLMEDISGYSDDQVGAAVRSLHEQSRAALARYVTLNPVIDAVEGTRTRIEKNDPKSVKLIGNVPANGKASQGILRHKGWRVEKVDLPKILSSQDANILAPAEIEIE
jgi:Domain of unknown function (DUF2760)